MTANQMALDVAQLAERLARGHLAYSTAIYVARNPRAKDLLEENSIGQVVPGVVMRKDGSQYSFFPEYWLNLGVSDPFMREQLDKVWLTGALLNLGDALSQNTYFDRAPELELVRHLRNGISHGNRFQSSSFDDLTKFPANNRLAVVKSDTQMIFEITLNLEGTTVLFDFMGPGDVIDLLRSVAIYLYRMGRGEPFRL